VKPLARFPTAGLSTTIAAVVDHYPGDPDLSCNARTSLMLGDVLGEALSEAYAGSPPAEKVSAASVYLAVPGGEMAWPDRAEHHRRAGNGGGDPDGLRRLRAKLERDGTTSGHYRDLQARFAFDVPPAIVSTACASGATAIQMGVDAIRRGDTEMAIAAGADSTVSPEGLIRFSLLSALSRRNDDPTSASRPFDRDRDGFVMGEGAAALILEDEDHAIARGAEILGFVAGCGDATDNFHRTRSNPSGERIRACIVHALEDAAITPGQISAVNAHGTSTPENDKMEALGLRLAFGDAIGDILVSSNKSMIGHTLAAAGLVEAAISLLSLRHGLVPPSANVRNLDETLGIKVALEATPVPDMRYILSNSFGFGGQNVSLVLERHAG